MSKQAYLVAHYCYHTCSECGVRYSDKEYYNYYCIDKIIRWNINCKKCGAVFSEKPKRCYHSEHNPGKHNACSEEVIIDGVGYCTRQLKVRREELRSWGAYYSCDYYKPPKKADEFTQLSFFEV